MDLIFTPEQFRILQQAFDAAAPDTGGSSNEPPVPYEHITSLRYKMEVAESSRQFALDLDDAERSSLRACFNVGAEMLEMDDADYQPIAAALA